MPSPPPITFPRREFGDSSVLSGGWSDGCRGSAGLETARTMQNLHTCRTQLRHRVFSAGSESSGVSGFSPVRSRGFTLVELMVTVAVLAVLAAAALAGFRQDQYSGQYKRFVEDSRGALLTARNAAIDDQTLVDVDIDADEIRVSRLDQTTGVWELIERAALDLPQTELAQSTMCIYGLVSGVQTPRQAADIDPPGACLGDTQTLRFEPDGSFSDPDSTFTTVENVGVTLWIANEQMAGNTKLAMIQVFPGGLIRAFDKTEQNG